MKPVQRARKFSAVWGTSSPNKPITILPASFPTGFPMLTSKYTLLVTFDCGSATWNWISICQQILRAHLIDRIRHGIQLQIPWDCSVGVSSGQSIPQNRGCTILRWRWYWRMAIYSLLIPWDYSYNEIIYPLITTLNQSNRPNGRQVDIGLLIVNSLWKIKWYKLQNISFT